MLVAHKNANVSPPRRGATMMEYLLVLSLIGVACIVGISYFGTQTNNLTQSASSAISKSLAPGAGTTINSNGFGTIGPDEEEKDGTKDKTTKDKTKPK